MIGNMRRFDVAVALLAAGLGGCGHVPVTTVYKLMTFDAATADPASFRAAVRYPGVLVPRPGGVVFIYSSSAGAESASNSHAFVLEETREPSEAVAIARYARPGDTVTAYRLSDADVRAVRKLQAEHRAMKLSARGNLKSEISVKAEACRNGDLPKGAILSSTFLKLDASEGYLTVLEDVDLRSQLSAAELERNVPPCGDGKR